MGALKLRSSLSAIVRGAILSRAFVLVISLIIGSVLNIPDYDSSSNLPLVPSDGLDGLIQRVIGRFLKWDAVYFVRIAEYGYEYEQFYAFFPFYPILMKYFAKVIMMPLWWITERSAIMLAGFIISNVSFVFSAVQLYKLGCVVLRDENIAFISAMLYTITPSSIFMSAIYTESVYALLVFSALYFLATNNLIISSLSFFFATFTRSNGILLTGFIIFHFFSSLFHSLFSFFVSFLPSSQSTKSSKENFQRKIRSESNLQIRVHWPFYIRLILAAVMCSLAVLPFFGFQLYGKLQFCSEDPKARVWCQTTLPSLYGFVQDFYWNQGFFHYYEFKQISNFLLAGPMVVISFCGIYIYLKDRIQHIQQLRADNDKHKSKSGYFDPQVLPYVLYWAAILIFSLSFMHVQVITRFFSSSPAVFWFCGYIFYNKKYYPKAKSFILGYFLLYVVLGTSMFVLFYPWT